MLVEEENLIALRIDQNRERKPPEYLTNEVSMGYLTLGQSVIFCVRSHCYCGDQQGAEESCRENRCKILLVVLMVIMIYLEKRLGSISNRITRSGLGPSSSLRLWRHIKPAVQ